MGRAHYVLTFAGVGLLFIAGIVAWRTWGHTSAGTFDPVGAVISLCALAAALAVIWQGQRAQHMAGTDVADAARRLAIQVRDAETRERRQMLGGHEQAIDLRFEFRPGGRQDAEGAKPHGKLKEVVKYYQELRPRRMVITGLAGSGKTLLAVELILGLLEARTDDAPVPVRLSAARLDLSSPVDTAVPEWLAAHLIQAYQLPDDTARELVRARMVLPVLDGLDELDAVEQPGYASRAAQAIRACNAYLDGSKKAAIVLTCRIGQYQALEQAREWLLSAARIELRPVDLAGALAFLGLRAIDPDRWQPVLTAMEDPGHAALAVALSTPWRLTLAATVYDQREASTGRYLREPVELTGAELDTEDDIRDHLLGLFIPAATNSHPCDHDAATVHRWLGVLATYLDRNTPGADHPGRALSGRPLSGTDIVLHELWPLAGLRLPRLTTALVTVSVWVAFGLVLYGQIPHTSRLLAAAAVEGATMICAVWFATEAWPGTSRISFRQLKTGSGRRELAGWIVVSVLIGLGFAYALGRGGLPVALWLIIWLGAGLVGGLVVGLAIGFDPSDYSVTGPRDVIRADRSVGLVTGVVLGLAVATPVGTHIGVRYGLLQGAFAALGVEIAGILLAGLLGAFVGGLIGGLASGRYLVLLACSRRWTKHWLPLRLGEFLDWCYEAGLVRVAGISYQFRHKELQDYLARYPRPVN